MNHMPFTAGAAFFDGSFKDYLHKFTGKSFMVYVALCLHADKYGEATVTLDTLSTETGLTKAALNRYLRFLRSLRLDGEAVLSVTSRGCYLINPHLEDVEENKYFPLPTA